MKNKVDGLTQYQAAQLLHVHFNGEFCYQKQNGNKVVRSVWRKMIDVLLERGFLDNKDLHLTTVGKAWLDEHHSEIDYKAIE